MRLKIFIITFLTVLQSTISLAQKSETKKTIRFHSINQVGVLAGSSDAALQLQTINGINNKTWFAGLGVGLDYYYARSIPVFLDLRKDIFNKPTTPFIYVDGGYHFPWTRKHDAALLRMPEYKKGFYYDAGFGYRVPVNLQTALVLSAGVSEKRFSEEMKQVNPCLIPPCPEEVNTYHYKLRRLSFKMGIVF